MEYHIIKDTRGRIVGQGGGGLDAFANALARHPELEPYGPTFYELGELPDGWKVRKMKGRRVRNFTPHDLTIWPTHGTNDKATTWESEGSIRALEEDDPLGECAIDEGLEVDMLSREYVGTEGAPDLPAGSNSAGRLREGDLLVVSLVAGQALEASGALEAFDPYGITVVMPDTGPGGVVRDDEGRILGTRRLVMV